MKNTLNLKGVTRDTWVRLILLILISGNTLLNNFGITYFNNVDVNEWYDVISVLVAIAYSFWCAWKNNSFTVNAQNADKFLKSVRDNINEVYEE